jgi:hypothetical protein
MVARPGIAVSSRRAPRLGLTHVDRLCPHTCDKVDAMLELAVPALMRGDIVEMWR